MYAIGVDLGGTNIKLGIVSNKGKIINITSVKTHADEGPDKVISQIIKGINHLQKGAKVKIKGIGIGAPGVVKHKKGIVEHPPNLPGWGKVELRKVVRNSTGVNVFIENDANAAAIGEMIFGAGVDLESFIMITLGTGVGGGIIRKRKVFRGETNAAGEIGHVSINYNGPKCRCGSRGCIETYVGNAYLTKRTRAALKKHPESKLNKIIEQNDGHLSPRLISEAASAGDEFAKSVAVTTGNLLGFALAGVVNVLDIANVIIGGGVAGFGEVLFDSIESALKERTLQSLRERVSVLPASLSNNAGIKGASSLVFYNL
jgi:glucokinase